MVEVRVEMIILISVIYCMCKPVLVDRGLEPDFNFPGLPVGGGKNACRRLFGILIEGQGKVMSVAANVQIP